MYSFKGEKNKNHAFQSKCCISNKNPVFPSTYCISNEKSVIATHFTMRIVHMYLNITCNKNILFVKKYLSILCNLLVAAMITDDSTVPMMMK
jgi:hypothetical protein